MPFYSLPSNSMFPDAIKEIVNNVFSETVIKSAKDYIRKYETETDAQLLYHGLIAIRNMLIQMNTLSLRPSTYQFDQVFDELKWQIKGVERVIIRIRGKRPVPSLSNRGKRTVAEIEKAWAVIRGQSKDVTLKNITPLLLEASHNHSK